MKVTIATSVLFLTATISVLPAQSRERPVLLRMLTGNRGRIVCLAVSLDAKTLVSGGGTLSGQPRDRTIKFWDVTTGKETASFDGQATKSAVAIRTVALSPDGKRLASAGDEKHISIWDLATTKRMQLLEDEHGAIWSVAFSPRKDVIASTSSVPDSEAKAGLPLLGAIKLWDLITKKSVATYELGIPGSAHTVTFSPDGSLVASGGPDAFIRVWNVGAAEKAKKIGPHFPNVEAIAFSPDGSILASGATVNAKGASLKQGVSTFRIDMLSIQQKKKGTPFDRTVRLWDVKTGNSMMALEGHAGDVLSVAFSADGKTLASASMDATIRLWDVATGNSLAVIDGHAGGVNAVVFSPDGKWLASGGQDKTIKIWEIKR